MNPSKDHMFAVRLCEANNAVICALLCRKGDMQGAQHRRSTRKNLAYNFPPSHDSCLQVNQERKFVSSILLNKNLPM